MESLTLLQRVETVLDGWVSVKAILRTASSIFYFFSRTFLFWTIWCCVSTEHGINLPQIFLSLTKHHLFWSNGSFFCIFRIHLPFPLFRYSGDLNSKHLNNKLSLIRYSDVLHSKGSQYYSNEFLILNHLAIWQLSTIWILD